MRAVASPWPPGLSSSLHSVWLSKCWVGALPNTVCGYWPGWKLNRMATASACGKLSACREGLTAKETTMITWDGCVLPGEVLSASLTRSCPGWVWRVCQGRLRRERDVPSIPQCAWRPISVWGTPDSQLLLGALLFSDGVPLLSFWPLLALTLESAAAFSVASLCSFSKVETSAGLGCPSQPFGGSLLSSGWSPSSLVPHLTPCMTCCVLYPWSSAWVTLFLQHAGFSLAFRRLSSVLPATTLSVCSLPAWLLFLLHKVAYSSSTQYVSEWLEGLLKHTWLAPPSAFLVP